MNSEMEYTSRLLKNESFLSTLQEIRQFETDRIYCHHEIGHALDVCRIAWIHYLEDHLHAHTDEDWTQIKDRIYVAGLLHDIGRAEQYATGVHHSVTGVRLARQMLEEIRYPETWTRETLQIITEHYGRDEKENREKSIGFYIEQADHLSRNCFCCEAQESCKWKQSERNCTVIS